MSAAGRISLQRVGSPPSRQYGHRRSRRDAFWGADRLMPTKARSPGCRAAYYNSCAGAVKGKAADLR